MNYYVNVGFSLGQIKQIENAKKLCQDSGGTCFEVGGKGGRHARTLDTEFASAESAGVFAGKMLELNLHVTAYSGG